MSDPVSSNSTNNVDDFVVELLGNTLNIAMDQLRQDGELPPLIVTISGDTREVAAVSLTADVSATIRRYLAQVAPEVEAYAFAVEATIPIAGQSTPVIIVQAARRGQSNGYGLAQPYMMDPDNRPIFEETTYYLGAVEQLLAAQ
jgi:hypothetical protein